jgi:hypothetical protein
MAGYVSADKNADGDVNKTPDYLHKRFFPSLPRKPGALSLNPDLNDAVVYQDEFVNWIEKSARQDPNQVIFYDLDNEPDIWAATHARIHPEKITYAEIVQRTIDYASAIKRVKPDALVFGAVNYGWNGYRTLQNAPDGADRDFHPFFLSQMKAAEEKAGRRLLDVLDVHWYPEAQSGDGLRITEKNSSPPVIKARLQAPRSLWDPTYVEKSWITKDSTEGQPIQLLPRLRKDIETNYPGTKVAITEYNYGGGDDISGAIAEADVLGIFGRQGVFCANWWDLGTGKKFVDAASGPVPQLRRQGRSFRKPVGIRPGRRHRQQLDLCEHGQRRSRQRRARADQQIRRGRQCGREGDAHRGAEARGRLSISWRGADRSRRGESSILCTGEAGNGAAGHERDAGPPVKSVNSTEISR